MQEKLLSAGGFPYFPQGNPGRFMCACLCSAYTVKANVFWTPRALLSFLKCCSARWAQPVPSHAGVDAPLVQSTHGLARAAPVLGSEPLPPVSPQTAWNPGPLPQASFFNAGMKFRAGKRGAVGAAEVVAARDARGCTVQKSTGSKIKPLLLLSSEDAERCLWIALFLICEFS